MKKIKVLYIDDSIDARNFILRGLRGDGKMTVTVATDGKEGIDILKSGKKFDIVLTDTQMPTPGREVVQFIKKNCPELPVIMKTAAFANPVAEEEKVPSYFLYMGTYALIEMIEKILSERREK